MDKIPYTKPSITELEQKYCMDAVTNGWGENCYDYVYSFEERFAEYLGVKFALSTSSCTGALTIGLAALGLKPGDEVILADTNWIATVSPIVSLGAKPVFVDIDPVSWCIDPQSVIKNVNEKTKVIMATHLYGNPCNLNALIKIGLDYNIHIVEDAAEAIGTELSNKKAGSIGAFGTFSFHGTKTITTGEGGMFVTSDKDLYEKALTLSNHGRERTQVKQFWPDRMGFKFKMSNVQAAIGVAQLSRIDALVKRKREILAFYKEKLRELDGIHMNFEPQGCINGAWMPTIVFDKRLNITREKLLNSFQEERIDARVFFWPLSSLPMFENAEYNKNSYDIPKRSLNLPSFHDISEAQCNRIVAVIKRIYHSKKN